MQDNSAMVVESKTWMRIADAVEESKTSTSTVRRLMDEGTLHASKFGGTVLIDRASFNAAFQPVAPKPYTA